MDDRLLTYYNRELAYIRKMGAEFAQKHPKIAGRLRLDQESVDDPHVSRLIESFAFLTARVRHTIDDSFPELTESLIGLMCPAYHAPLPSMSVIKCHVIPGVPQYQFLPKGTRFNVDAGDSGKCYFRACDDIHCLPVEIHDVRFIPGPVNSNNIPGEPAAASQCKSLLKVGVRSLPGAKIGDMNQSFMRFYISAQSQVAYQLLDYFAGRLIGGCISDSHQSRIHQTFEAGNVTFPEIGMFPGEEEHSDGRNHTGYQELTDYFVFPQKFLFIDVHGLSDIWQISDEGFYFHFYFNDSSQELSQTIDSSSLELGCVPVINLFKDRTAPIDVTKLNGEEKLRSRSYQDDLVDIHSIHKVRLFNAKGELNEVAPFYGSHKFRNPQKSEIYWHMRRENSQLHNGFASRGTDTYLSLIDRDFRVVGSEERWLIDADVICTNRDAPSRLPFGPGQPKFSFAEGGAGLRLKCLTPPTATYQPRLDEASRWDLVTQLTLQSFTGDNGITVLRSVLSLYDLKDSRETRSLIKAIESLDVSHITDRVIIGGRAAFCMGVMCELTLSDSDFSGNSMYLFGRVIHRFLGSITAINSFVVTRIRSRIDSQIIHEWAPVVGSKPLM